jgi:isoleucyl-tRNA synthetase
MKFNSSKLENKVLKYWQKENILNKSLAKKKKSNFVFYEGPPTANAKPGFHHALARSFKDIICRYKAMRGFLVERKAGWDTHGLPVELQIEKKLGFKSKKDIENYGIKKFNKLCKASVWQYKKDWEKFTDRIGFWLDMKNPYITYNPEYIESVWWILKQISDNKLLEQDFKVVPYCPRCGTPLSSHEVAQGYKKIKENSVYVKLRVRNPEYKNTSFLVWTTTPWTLPGNVGLAVNPDAIYVLVKINNEQLILAKERLNHLGIRGEIIKEIRGKNLVDLRYEELYSAESDVVKAAYRVVAGDFVSLEEGTGIVHIAPAFGVDDMDIARKNKLPVIVNVDEGGRFKLNVKKWAGMYFRDANDDIVADLKQRELLFQEKLYEHDYPFCWRCSTPLLYYAKRSWFITTTKVRKDLLANNKKINWIPNHLKEGRFGEWLRGIRDWAISRERYWGTPLPVWNCEKCKRKEFIGSIKDLASKEYSSNNYYILRHGENTHQVKFKDKIYPASQNAPIHLTSKGRNQIKALLPRLRKAGIDVIYSSDFIRTKETSDIVAQDLDIKVKLDKRLRDMSLGVYHGHSKKEFYEDFPLEERFDKKPKNGESWLGCKKRVLSFIKATDKKHKDKNILLVGHGDPLWLLEGAMKGLSRKELANELRKGKFIKVGELREIKFTQLPYDEKAELDLHRPYIDEVKFLCQNCGDPTKRVPDVIDVWFDSGAMPFAQYHYPFENKKLINQKKQFPADFISEAIDQTRGWFYTLVAISTLLGKGTAYKNVISTGHILDENGEKMSKSKGNIVDPWYVFEKYGADAIRWYFYTLNQPGDPKLFVEKDLENSLRKFILTLWNSYVFLRTYGQFKRATKAPKAKSILDKWIVSRLNELIINTTKQLDNYNITAAARSIEAFTINDLSLWYIRRSRKRFQNPNSEKELKEASAMLYYVLSALIRLSASFIPFLSEDIYQNIENKNYQSGSVHLENWPKANSKSVNKKLNEKMKKVREIVAKALAKRAEAGIKVRQPLPELQIGANLLKSEQELLELIKEEINVKKITFGKELKLNTKITSDLQEEGVFREVVRNIKQMRKAAGYTGKDIISVAFVAEESLRDILLKKKDHLLKEAKAKSFEIWDKKTKFKIKKEVTINGSKIKLLIKK